MKYAFYVVCYIALITLGAFLFSTVLPKQCTKNFCVTQEVVVPSGEVGTINKLVDNGMLPTWQVKIKRGSAHYFVTLPEIQLKRAE